MLDLKPLLKLIGLALLIKFVLFSFITIHAPSSKFEIDSYQYLQNAENLTRYGAFAQYRKRDGTFQAEVLRTPGYPIFLGIFHYLFDISLDGIVILQIFLTILAAILTYKTALLIDKRLGLLSAFIILFDPPITTYSFLILTEPLFLLSISLFMYIFVLYLQNSRLFTLILSGIFITMATYIRPACYFLGIACAGFIFLTRLKSDWRRAIISAMILLLVTYVPLGLWQYRNYHRVKRSVFSDIHYATVEGPSATGLWRSYSRQQDPSLKNLPPIAYYANVTSRCLISLFTRPGTFKYFKSRPLTVAGKVFGYPWLIFWMIGFIFGLTKLGKDKYLHFLAFVILYLTAITLVATMWGANERFRVPMMPFIAILSAWGWNYLLGGKLKTLK